MDFFEEEEAALSEEEEAGGMRVGYESSKQHLLARYTAARGAAAPPTAGGARRPTVRADAPTADGCPPAECFHARCRRVASPADCRSSRRCPRCVNPFAHAQLRPARTPPASSPPPTPPQAPLPRPPQRALNAQMVGRRRGDFAGECIGGGVLRRRGRRSRIRIHLSHLPNFQG